MIGSLLQPGGQRANRTAFGPTLEEAPAGQLQQRPDCLGKERGRDFLGDSLSTFRSKSQHDHLAADGDIRFEQRHRTARAAQPRVAFVAGPYRASRHEIDDRGASELTRALERRREDEDPLRVPRRCLGWCR